MFHFQMLLQEDACGLGFVVVQGWIHMHLEILFPVVMNTCILLIVDPNQ